MGAATTRQRGARAQQTAQTGDVVDGRQEVWTRIEGGRTVLARIDVTEHNTVEITHELLTQLLVTAGWQKAADPSV